MDQNTEINLTPKPPAFRGKRTKCLNIRLTDYEWQAVIELLEARNINGTNISEKIRKMFDRDYSLYVTKSPITN